MISWKEILNGYKEEDIPKDVLANLKELHRRINLVRDLYGKPMKPTSVYRSMEDHLRIYKEKGITDKAKIPMKSKHLFGEAIDVYDPKGELMDWCMSHVSDLETIQLWCEERDSTPRVHFQIVPPKSGNRFFKP